MIVRERRIVEQQWYETEWSKTGWDTHGWFFKNGEQIDNTWDVVSHLTIDKHGNPWIGIAERDFKIT